jgi:hypothetical protein
MTAVSALTVLAICAVSTAVDGQEGERRQVRRDPVPREVIREIEEIYNDPQTTRVEGRLVIAEDRTINGDVAVAGGPTLTIAGRVIGRVLAVNTDVVLRRGARVDGDMLIVGGRLEGRDDARIEGDVRIYPQSLRYEIDGERLIADERQETRPSFGRVRAFGDRTESQLSLTVSPYNRVEGLPIHFGPALRHRTPGVDLRIDALGTIRSADDFRWNSDNLGHDALIEIRSPASRGIGIGGRLYDRIDPMERWHLSDTEAALSTFVLHRDFRDYWERHGGGVHMLAFTGSEQQLTVGYSEERWRSRTDLDPWTLFRDDDGWRPNPAVDEGKIHLATARFLYDTRNDEDDPWTGWLIDADVEFGNGELSGPVAGPIEQEVKYTRAFADLRRYNRLSRDAQLNLRFVYGGWVGGDELPLQRRFSIGGAGTLPGFDFRRNPGGGPDVGTCNTTGLALPGSPALCERVVLAQIEYRGSLGFGRMRPVSNRRWWGEQESPQWVVFADAGRGWLVGDEDAGDEIEYAESTVIPPLETFRTDVGFGLDAGFVGFFIAKSVSHTDIPANFFVRVRHRF